MFVLCVCMCLVFGHTLCVCVRADVYPCELLMLACIVNVQAHKRVGWGGGKERARDRERDRGRDE